MFDFCLYFNKSHFMQNYKTYAKARMNFYNLMQWQILVTILKKFCPVPELW